MSDDPSESGDNSSESDDLSTEGGDPFEHLADGREREGNPFEQLPDGTESVEHGGGESGPDRPDPRDVSEPIAGESDGEGSEADPEPGVPPGDPFEGYETPSGDPFESGAGVFDSAGGGTVDPDVVWERLAGSGDADEARQEDVATVPKRDFCERCEHFASPPAVRCTREGTEIAALPDMETVRVVDCPIVAERRRLGGLDE